MATLLEQPTTVEDKARELCEWIVEDPRFRDCRDHIEAFLQDEEAQKLYRSWQEAGHELHRKSHEGVSPSEGELAELESLRSTVNQHPVAAGFVEAEDALNAMFGTIATMVQKTLQLGRVPTPDDLAASGCCGGGGGGGCGCH